MKILLTGGTGFIGRNIRESFLSRKYEIYAPTRADLDCSNDESAATYFKKNSFDAVIHAAAKPGHRNSPDTSNLFFVNSRMILNILKHRDSWGKFIDMGSGAIYGMEDYKPKMKEEYFGTHIPKDEHGYNKYMIGLLLPHYKNTIDLRIFGVFGKYEDYAIRFISNAICKTLFDLPITIRQNRKFDYLYIDDLMPVIDYFVNNTACHSEYNVTPDNSIELLEIAQIIKDISGKKPDILLASDEMGIEYSGNNTRLKREVKNITFTPIKKSIERLYTWYEINKGQMDKGKLLADR